MRCSTWLTLWMSLPCRQLKEFEMKLKSTTKEGLDFGDQDEKKTLEELKIEPESLGKLMMEALGDRS